MKLGEQDSTMSNRAPNEKDGMSESINHEWAHRCPPHHEYHSLSRSVERHYPNPNNVILVEGMPVDPPLESSFQGPAMKSRNKKLSQMDQLDCSIGGRVRVHRRRLTPLGGSREDCVLDTGSSWLGGLKLQESLPRQAKENTLRKSWRFVLQAMPQYLKLPNRRCARRFSRNRTKHSYWIASRCSDRDRCWRTIDDPSEFG